MLPLCFCIQSLYTFESFYLISCLPKSLRFMDELDFICVGIFTDPVLSVLILHTRWCDGTFYIK